MTQFTDLDALALQRCRLFKNMSLSDLGQVVDRCKRRVVPAAQTIVHQGEPGNSMLVVVQGAVEYLSHGKIVGRDQAGAFFGEIALLSASATRAVTVRAAEECQLLELYRVDFDDVVKRHPSVGYEAVKVMTERLAAAMPKPLLKNKSSSVLIGVLAALVAKLLTKYLPADLANEAAQTLVVAAIEYAVPAATGLVLLLRNFEINNVKAKLFG